MIAGLTLMCLNLCAGTADSLRKELALSNLTPLEQLKLNLELYDHYRYSSSDSMLNYLDQAKTIAKTIDTLPQKIDLELLQNEAYYYYVIDENRKAISFCIKLIDKSLEYKNYDKLSFGYNNLSGNYKNIGKKDSMHWALDTAIFIAEQHNLYKNLAAFYQNKGNHLTDEDRFNEGMEYYLKAIEMHQRNGELEEVGLIYYSLGLTFSELEDFKSAQEYFVKAIEIHAKNENWHELIRCYNGQGVAFKNDKQFERAINCFQRAMEIGEPKQMKGELLQVYYNLANTFIALKQYQKAEPYLLEGMAYCKTIGLAVGQRFYAYGLADLYTQLKKPNEAKKYIELFENFAPEHTLPLAEKQSFFELKSNYYTLIKDFEKAWSYERKSRIAGDSLSNIQQDEKILSLEKKYSKEKIENENELLKKTNQLSNQQIENRNQQLLGLGVLALVISISLILVFIGYRKNKKLTNHLKAQTNMLDELNKSIQQKNSELEQTIEEKEKILYQVSHDFKNQMTSIFGVSELLKEETIPDHIKGHIDIIHEASEDTIEIIDELLDTSKKDWVLKNQEIDFEKMVIGIEKGFSPQLNGKNLKFEFSAPPNFMFQSNKVIVSRILQNLIANSIKYTDQNGNITISAKNEAGKVILSVIDTGKGFSEEQKKIAFNQRMIEQEKQVESFGFGLLIVKDLADKIGASIELESEVGDGSKISIIL